MVALHLILGLFLALGPQAQALTLSTVRADCRTLAKDTGTSRQRFTDSQLLRFINEGQKDMVSHTWPIRKSTEFDLAGGTTFYTMPDSYIHPERVTLDYLLLEEWSIAKLDKQQNWEETPGYPVRYYTHFASRTLLGFYPWPDTSASTGTVRMSYIAQADELSADSDSIFNGITELQQYGYGISLYCGYRAGLIDGQVAQAQAYMAEYQRVLQRLSEDAVARPNYKPGATVR